MRRREGFVRGIHRRGRLGAARQLVVPLLALLCAALPAGAAAAPPGRGYELVSPAEKGGSDVYPLSTGGLFTPIASSDGNSVAFVSLDAIQGTNPASNAVLNFYRASRSSGGWASEELNPPLLVLNNLNVVSYSAFSPDLSKGVQLGVPAGTETTTEVGNLYLRDSAGFHLITPGIPAEANVEVTGRSADLSHVVFTVRNGQLNEEAPPGAQVVLYDWNAATDTARIVGRMPNGEASPSQVNIATPPGVAGGMQHLFNPVSADGSKIFFYTPEESSQRQLYVRIGGSETRWVSESKRSTPDPEGTKVANFRFASTDGSVAFFSSAQKLTDDATTGPADGGQDLYRYDVATEALTDITVDGADANGAEVQGVIGGSSDGKRLYFVAKGVLAPGATGGAENLYMWTDDGSAKGKIAFIASGVSPANWEPRFATLGEQIVGRVTPDGMHLLLESATNLTPYDSAGHLEAYLFDAATGQIVCASCNPAGTPASADAQATGTNEAIAIPHTLSEDGSRVYFSTAEQLVPADTNAAEDTYEYDAASGQVTLISSGQGEYASPFSDATPNGSDVLFLTRQQLVGIDRDENYDAYDARLGGGIPAQNPAAPPTPCTGQECRDTVAQAPPVYTPASSTFSGPRNRKRHHRHHGRHHHAHHGKGNGHGRR
ncbi:MAG TPA: hypothetical protein VF731_01215 [Solirubrobacterales bacterium]